MTRKELLGGWYVDALATGDYAGLYSGSHIVTSRGTVSLASGENPLYLRAAIVGDQLKLCGQGGVSDSAYEWTGSAWLNHGPVAGVSPVIFNAAGEIVLAGPAQGSQGFRYLADDGSLVSGDDTYNSATPFAIAKGVSGLWEWTQYGDLTVGQNWKDECIVVGPVGRRVLERGTCRFIRFHRIGPALAIAIWKPTENKAVIHWLTTAELALLPLEEQPGEPDPPPVDPPPVDPPAMRLPDNVFATLQAIRPKYPTPLGNQGAALLNEVAWIHRAEGFGLESKAGGNTCPQPTTGTACGCDILRTQTLGWDVLQDTEGAGNPIQSESGPADPSRFVAPVAPGGVVDPPPVDPPPSSNLEARVKALEDTVARHGTALTAMAERLLLLTGRVEQLEQGNQGPPPEVIQIVNGQLSGTFTGTITRS